jgi:hypothetical protein
LSREELDERRRLGRFEANQWKRPEMSDIRDLLRIYGADEHEQAAILDVAVRARARPWWREFGDVFENEFPGFENDATRIRVFMPLVIPGLLQTKDYAEAFLRSGPRSPAWRRKALETRLRRQEIIDRTDGKAPRLIAVITEASLLYEWGARYERRRQIEHLAELNNRTNVELRIQRFADGPPAGLLSSVNIFDFPDDEPGIVYAETEYSLEEVSGTQQVNNYIEGFIRAADTALEPADTVTYLGQLAERLE